MKKICEGHTDQISRRLKSKLFKKSFATGEEVAGSPGGRASYIPQLAYTSTGGPGQTAQSCLEPAGQTASEAAQETPAL